MAAALAWWVRHACRGAPWVLALALASAAWGLVYTTDHLGVDTSTADMFSIELPWRRHQEAYRNAFPQFGDSLLVVLDGRTPELAAAAAERLAHAMAALDDVFAWVSVPGGGEHFDRNALLYESVAELRTLGDRLADAQPVLGRLASDPSLRGLLGVLADLGGADADLHVPDLVFFYDALADAAEATLAGRLEPVSWLALSRGEPAGADLRRSFVEAYPRLDYEELFPAGDAIARVRALAQELAIGPDAGVRLRITGGTALAHEELLSVTRGAKVAGIGALIGVTVILLWGLASVRLVIAGVACLLIGLSWTVWFAAYAVGHLNLISIAFAVLYIGLGIDYVIHLCLRVRELMQDGLDREPALTRAAGDVGGSLVICAVTTGTGFFAFVPSDFSGVSELGLMSGTGMLISLVASLTVLPACLTLVLPAHGAPATGPGEPAAGTRPRPGWTAPGGWERRLRTPVLAIAVAGTVVAGLLAARADFDYNPLNLRDPESESVSTYLELLAEDGRAPWAALVLAPTREAAQALAARAQALTAVNAVRLLDDLVPGDQDAKLALIEELDLLLGPVLELEPREPPEPGAVVAALDRLLETGPRGAGPGERRLLDALAQARAGIGPDGGPGLELLSRNLLMTLPLQLERLDAALGAEPVSLETLPPQLVASWRSPAGEYRVRIEPVEDLNDNAALRRFVDAVQSVAPTATGTPIINLEASRAVLAAFRTAFVYAFVLIALILALTLNGWRSAALVLAVVGLGSVYATAALVGLGLDFNFANVIALPLLLGIGVDNGVHMLHRMRTAPPRHGGFLGTSTARAVLVSALTTICGFGNLAFSPHQGMASMGLLLALGLGFSLVCTLVLLPVLLAWWADRRARAPA